MRMCTANVFSYRTMLFIVFLMLWRVQPLLSLGCDLKMASFQAEDECLDCENNVHFCKTVSGNSWTGVFKKGQVTEITTIAEDARSIVITFVPRSGNVVLKSDDGERLAFADFPCNAMQTMKIGGTDFSCSKLEDRLQFSAGGPLRKKLSLLMLPYNLNPMVEYEYSLPIAAGDSSTQRYTWLYGDWTQCSRECGTGYQLRAVKCRDLENNIYVDHQFCSEFEKPAANKTCNKEPCGSEAVAAYEWAPGHWGECDVECGVGKQTQLMYCIETDTAGNSGYVTEDLCTSYKGPKPIYQRSCKGDADNCPYWAIGDWNECSITCGAGTQFRQVYCQQDPPDETSNPVILDDSHCTTEGKPSQNRSCYFSSCDDASNRGFLYHTNSEEHHEPTQNCKTSKFGCCPDEISPAHGPSYAGCDFENSSEIDPCHLPSERGPCANYTIVWAFNPKENDCLRFWYGGCKGNGNRFDDKEKCRKRCLENRKPVETVLGCQGSSYGCCSDGVTYARGPDGDGCLERNQLGGCAGTRYGCCKDRVTSAQGPNREGCPETKVIGGCAGTRFGCCADGLTVARGENQLGCAQDSDLSCKDTQFGCCADGVATATGPNQKGCHEQGTNVEDTSCNGARYGCCPDGVSSAGGPNQEGCASFDPEWCGQPQEPGTCRDYTLFWFFEKDSGMCRQFWYGGCGGNANKFSTQEQCESKCIKVDGPGRCKLPMVIGSCKASKVRYYFNIESGQCEQFTYGGCKGNSNNFDSLTECQDSCGDLTGFEARSLGCVSNPCQNGFLCQEYHNSSYSCACGPDWGQNCFSPPDYWCFSDDECLRGLKCIRERKCSLGYCFVNATCAATSSEYACDSRICPASQDCVNDDSLEDGYFCQDKISYIRPYGVVLGCSKSKHGCCTDQTRPATGPNYQGCQQNCQESFYGCCSDGVTFAEGPDSEGCELGSGDQPCETSEFGCCEDGVAFAKGQRGEGCEDKLHQEDINPKRDGTGQTAEIGKCTAPMPRTLCTEYTVKWKYNREHQQCDRGWWGGCENNGNVFESQESCEAECMTHTIVITNPGDEDPDFFNICDMPMEKGPCRDDLLRYYYDPREQTCVSFEYGGCRGNENNFLSLQECQRECMGGIVSTVMTTPVPVQETVPPPTQQIQLFISGEQIVLERNELKLACQATGPIKVTLEWYFNNQPVSSVSGDVHLDDRNAITRDGYAQVSRLLIPMASLEDSGTYECRSSDGQFQTILVTVEKKAEVSETAGPDVVCLMDKESGNCEANIRRWYYDRHEGDCLAFTFGGCGGNGNNFESLEKCYNFCSAKEICLQSKMTGPCRASIPRFYFNSDTGSCGNFIYGGCRGNLNNFATMEACNHKCAPFISTGSNIVVTDTDICGLNPDKGTCQGYNIKWYYSSARNRCSRFIYTGCEGNRNRFDSENECNETCVRDEEADKPSRHHPRPTSRPELSSSDSNTICSMLKDRGNCHNYTVKWYYDSEKEQCLRFWYGGCDGNGNRFVNQDQCEKQCIQGKYATSRPEPVTEHPLACQFSTFGCCNDGVTTAVDQQKSNCNDNNVVVQPGTREEHMTILVRPGTDAVLKCPVRGSSVLWYRDGFLLQSSPRFQAYRNGTLALRRVTEDMSGMYTCRTSYGNNIPQLQRFKVDVNVPLSILPGPALMSVRPGDTAYMHCQAIGNPQPHVFWSRYGRVLQSNNQHAVFGNGTLIIRNVQTHDAGEYECAAENGIAATVKRKLTLNIKETIGADIQSHQGVFMEGDTIRLFCQGRGFPAPEVEWMKDEQSLETNEKVNVREGELVIHAAGIDDAGMYKCVATNGRDQAEDVTTVQIKLHSPQTKCEDTMKRNKCDLIVAGTLCGFRIFANKCCQSCRRAGFL